MLDQGILDQKILAYATGNPRFSGIHGYEEVPPHILREVAHFVSIYKDLEGKQTKALGWKGRKEAYQVIESSQAQFTAATSAVPKG